MTRDLSKEEYTRESTIYRFQNQLQIGRETARRLARRPGKLGVRADFSEGKPMSMTLEVPDEQNVLELAVVMGPLLRPTSETNYRRILELVGSVTARGEILREFEKVEARIKAGGGFSLKVNDQDIDAERAYLAVMNKIVEAGDVDAAKTREQWANDGLLEIMLFRCYNYCLDMCRALLVLDAKLRQAKAYPAPAPRDHVCIYCKSASGSFRSWEHTLPESAGNSHSVLPPGYSCDACNALMADVEQRALKQFPFALARILFLKHTKQGKFPEARFPNVHLRKTKPNHLVMTEQSGRKSLPEPRENPDGTVAFTLSAHSKFEHIVIGRVLVKGVLGAMALENARDYVLNPRFDAARTFVRTGLGLRARLFLSKNSKPAPGMRVRWWDRSDAKTGSLLSAAEVNVFGIRIWLGITDGDHVQPPAAEFLKVAEGFDLWNAHPGPHHTHSGGQGGGNNGT